MNKYEVTLYYHTHVVVEVEAENENEAIDNAAEIASGAEYDYELLSNLVGDNEPDVEEI